MDIIKKESPLADFAKLSYYYNFSDSQYDLRVTRPIGNDNLIIKRSYLYYLAEI